MQTRNDDRKDLNEIEYERGLAALHYEQLPLETRRWLIGLSKEDIDTLQQTIRFQEQTRTAGKLLKWFLVSFVAIVMFMTEFGHALSRFISALVSMTGGKGH